MLAYFSSFVRKLPILYTTFVYRRSEFADLGKLTERMRRDTSEVLLNHLGFFQSFDDVKVYYDNGQDIVKQALDRSVSQILSKGVVRERKNNRVGMGKLLDFSHSLREKSGSFPISLRR